MGRIETIDRCARDTRARDRDVTLDARTRASTIGDVVVDGGASIARGTEDARDPTHASSAVVFRV